MHNLRHEIGRKGLLLLTAGILFSTAARNVYAQRGRPGMRSRSTLEVGEVAPDFKLATLDSVLATTNGVVSNAVTRVSLSSYRGKRPVVIVLSSYT